MLARMKTTRLLLGLALGLAFFGCVGLPRRRPPTENPPRPSNAQVRQTPEIAPAPPLRIPDDPTPVPPPNPALAAQSSPFSTGKVPGQLTSTPRPAPVEPPPPTPTPPTPPPAPPAAPPQTDPFVALRRMHQRAQQQHDAIDSYVVRLTRREVVRGKRQPEEVMLFKFRKQPKSVYLKWIGSQGEGRETVWVEGQHEGKLHTLLAAGDMPFAPAGKRVSLAPDSVLVRANSRHSITEAGVGTMIERFGQLLDALERGDTRLGTATHHGLQKRQEFSQPLETVEWQMPPTPAEALPRGGRRWCFVDPEIGLPVLLITYDDRGEEVEYYRYDRYLFPANLDDDDFDPDKLWGTKE